MKNILLVLACFLFSCSHENKKLENALVFAGDNRVELEKVLTHYRESKDQRKYEAAKFLIANMGNKFHYKGEILDHYNRIFHFSDSLRKEREDDHKQQQIKALFNQLTQEYGYINLDNLDRNYDLKTLSADFLIRNIEQSFSDWQQSAWYKETDFRLFCEYILPYRIGHEKVEDYKERYSLIFSSMKDTISNPQQMMLAINEYLRKKMTFKTDRIFWQYSPDISISQMEQGRRGSCSHIANYTALVMKAAGLPVSVDHTVWGNRSGGHEWNVLVGDTGIFPVDVLEAKRMKPTYKPAKVFRKNYRNSNRYNLKNDPEEIPYEFIVDQDLDVTSQYVKAYTVSVPIVFPQAKKNRKYGVICTFDNSEWIPVFWGQIKKNKMIFTDMASDIVYLYGYYDNGEIIPAGHPFLLKEDGNIQFFEPDNDKTHKVILERKYPLLRNIQNMAWGLRYSVAEGSNDAGFKQSTPFFQLGEKVLSQVADSVVTDPTAYRFVRWHFGNEYSGNLAEVEFYGKRKGSNKEEKLTGKMIHNKIEKEGRPHHNAMDGDLETFFTKAKKSEGWIGLDLGAGNEAVITRVRYCPRSDTNFIMPGDVYELCYWNQDEWICLGKKQASEPYVVYEQVPEGALMILHNLSRGKEERIFAYEDGKQVWW